MCIKYYVHITNALRVGLLINTLTGNYFMINNRVNFGYLSRISVLLLVFIIGFAFSVAPAFSGDFSVMQHNATVTIDPDQASCENLGNTFTVNVENDGGYGIYNVKLYKAQTNIVNVSCGSAPLGWIFKGFLYGLYCEYETNPEGNDTIEVGETVDFTFNATLNQTNCVSTFRVTTLDNEAIVTGGGQGEEKDHYLNLSVDCTPPIIEKELESGYGIGVCPPDTQVPGDVCWIRYDTINVHVYDNLSCDPDNCNLGLDYCVWNYTVDGVLHDNGIEAPVSGYDDLYFNIAFDEDSVHNLTIVCYDVVGNMVEDIEVFRVDDTPPETTKTYGNPHYPTGINDANKTNYPHWITTHTPVTLTAIDPDPTGEGCNISNVTIYYRNLYFEPYSVKGGFIDYCANHLNCMTWKPGNPEGPDFEIYTGPFYKEEESCHIIEYYSIDELGNKEPIKHQCVYVEDTPPNGTKVIGEPKLGCSSINGSDCWWVRDHVTEINLTCIDPDPHPVGHEEVCYRISYDVQPWLTNTYCLMAGGTMQGGDDSYCCVDKEVTIVFQEDSLHDLEYYCRDVLNNTNEKDLEYFRVDSIPPIINKTIVGPQVGACPPRPGTSDICYIKDWTDCRSDGTTIHIEAYDNNTYENCTVGKVTCDWDYSVNGEPRKGGYGLVPPFDIKFYEDCVHELRVTCEDALGNEVTDVETFYVDSQPPETIKSYGEPQVIEPRCLANCESQCLGNATCVEECVHAMCTIWINSDTPVTLDATDLPDAPCAVGVNKTYWRNSLVDDMYCWNVYDCQYAQGNGIWNEYLAPFYKPDYSCHLIEYYSEDSLGNVEEIKKQCVFVDNLAPRGNKTVGEPKIVCDASEFNTSGGMSTLGGGSNPVTLYVIADNAGNPNTLEAYHVEANGSLTYAMTYNLPDVGNGAVGTALDTVNDQLFVTFELFGGGTGYVYVFDANNFNPIKNISTAGSDLAGIFVDETQGYLYVADRNGPNVYVYDTTTYAYITTYNVGFNIYGMAFDHNNNKIYVTGGSTSVYEFNTTMTLLNTYTLPNNNVGIAVDTRNPLDVYLYTTTWLYSPKTFTKYRINDGTSSQSAAMDNPAGIALHPTLNYVYLTSGDPNPHDLKVFDTNTLVEVQNIVMLGTATDLFVGEVVFVPYCGDNNLDPGEQCDDGNLLNGDGCDENCQIEYPIGPECWWVRDHVTLITLDCEDNGDHPVNGEEVCYKVSYDYVYNATSGTYDWGYITNDYCAEFGGTMEGDLCCASVANEPYVFNFTEDSVHNLEYYCRDQLNNTEETHPVQYYKVDSVPPNTTKTYLGAYYIDENGAKYIDTESWIELTAEDGGEICAVGVDEIQYRVSGSLADKFCEPANCGNWMITLRPQMGPWNTYTQPFGILDESCHVIEYRSVDYLGNTEEIQWQCVFVDKTPPVTTKTYSEPYYEAGDECGCPGDNCTKWITSETNVTLTADDPLPHPSGVNETYYTDTYLTDESDWHYCYNNCTAWNQDARFALPTAPEPYNPANVYTYTGLEESCHIIEYHSVDNVNKTEEIQWQCVFVDNTAPVPNKIVGEPKSPMSQENKENGKDYGYPELDPEGINICNESSDKCWDVTLLTPISLECVDPEPHPSGATDICFKVDWDNTDITEQYCGGGTINGEGYCCITDGTNNFNFVETTYHKLEYYCVDNVGNVGEPDIEYFKVAETGFNITLNKKWNLISVPVNLLDDSMDEVFESIADEVVSVWQFDGTNWHVYTPDGDTANDDITTMHPGWGYWVLTTNATSLTIGGELLSGGPGMIPSIPIVYGWNLLGYFGADGKESYEGPVSYDSPVGSTNTANCKLGTLRNAMWPFGVTTPSLATWWEPYNTDGNSATHTLVPLVSSDLMDPGAGYWLFYSGTHPDAEYSWIGKC